MDCADDHGAERAFEKDVALPSSVPPLIERPPARSERRKLLATANEDRAWSRSPEILIVPTDDEVADQIRRAIGHPSLPKPNTESDRNADQKAVAGIVATNHHAPHAARSTPVASI